jgi:hypothetical protein
VLVLLVVVVLLLLVLLNSFEGGDGQPQGPDRGGLKAARHHDLPHILCRN